MTTIVEDSHGEAAAAALDLEQLLTQHLAEEAPFTSADDAAFGLSSTADPTQTDTCPLHPDAINCDCGAFLHDWDLSGPAANLSENPVLPEALEEPDYTRFENWIPRFVRPEKPCDYCRSKRLSCYVQRGEPSCTPCATLFRECSLSQSNTLESNNYVYKDKGTFLDTLHVVDEDVCKERGMLTGIKMLKSKDIDHVSFAPVRDDAPGSTKRNGIRFPRHAVKTLRDWLDSHADNPYPTEDEKAELEKKTELKPSQIANWLANARRRRKVTEKARPRMCMSPSLRPTTAAIDIPSAPAKPWDELNPFERWQLSPPENDPATMTDIAKAVANNDLPEPADAGSPSTLGRSSKRRKGSSSGSGWSNHQAQSVTSAETGQTSSMSASTSAVRSNGSSHSTHGSFGSFSSSLAGKKDRRRRRRPTAPARGTKLGDDRKRIFQCTFCTDTFKSKYDWTRHEKSLHLSLEKWICAPLGPVITNQESGQKQCVYCDLHNPSSDHIESHNHRQCDDKGMDARTFYRKDHLRQHLRLMHGCEMTSSMDSWKSIAVSINSRCGFCAQRFTKWQDRVDHLTAHFKAGSKMGEWKGCRGLDPNVAAQVTNAMPPYLIGMESVSPNPFSATNRGSWRNADEFSGPNCPLPETRQNQNPDPAYADGRSTCWEILTVRLGKYAKEMADQGVIITDEMLQTQARKILYDSEDPWEQTAADNLEWLDLFKKAHGLNFIPSAIGGEGNFVPDDLETYGDLGLRIPFAVQLRAYNQSQTGSQSVDAATRPGPYESARTILRDTYLLLRNEGVLYDGNQQCDHEACAANLLDISTVESNVSPGRTMRRWCSKKLSLTAFQRLGSIRGSSTTKTMSPSENRAQALAALWDLEAREHQHDESCSATHDARHAAGCRAEALQALHQIDVNHNCQVHMGDGDIPDRHSALSRAQSRAAALNGLERMEAPEIDGDALQALNGKTYLPRHRYELPPDKARLFATTTPAWKECGLMPSAVDTSLSPVGESVMTGAMAEFLGGNLGASLPFIHDQATSELKLPDFAAADRNWQVTEGADLSQDEIDQLLSGTSIEEFNSGMTAMDLDWNLSETQPAGSTLEKHTSATTGIDDMTFDDINFDGVFDMPLDETFGPMDDIHMA